MINISELTTSQLHRIVAIKERIENLQSELESLIAVNGDQVPATRGKRKMSAAAKAKIAAAARARWARVKGTAPKAGKRKFSAAASNGSTKTKKASKKADRRMSPAVKARLAEIARARWAKVKAAGKSAL